MSRIQKINPETAPEEVQKTIREHLAKGYRLTNEKLTLLYSIPCFQAIEAGSYAVDEELASIVGKRAADIYEYAISAANDCIVCTTYFKKLLDSEGIDLHHFEFTKDEELLVEFARALANDPRHIPADLKDRMQARYNDREFVVITSMGIMMLANNYFNDIMEVEPERL